MGTTSGPGSHSVTFTPASVTGTAAFAVGSTAPVSVGYIAHEVSISPAVSPLAAVTSPGTASTATPRFTREGLVRAGVNAARYVGGMVGTTYAYNRWIQPDPSPRMIEEVRRVVEARLAALEEAQRVQGRGADAGMSQVLEELRALRNALLPPSSGPKPTRAD